MICRYLLTCGLGLLLAACGNGDSQNLLVGQLESDRIELSAEFAEPVAERRVVEGEAVDAGHVLMAQDIARADSRVAEAEAWLHKQQARLSELVRGPRREQIEAAQANVDGGTKEVEFRTLELSRTQSLLDKKLAPPELRDNAKIALDNARSALDVATAQLQELLAGTTVEEVNQARAEVERAVAQLSLREIDRRRHFMIAPVDGVVDTLLYEVGERPAPGQTMLVMLGGQQPYARVFVPEAFRAQFTPGTVVDVSIDGITETVTGKVRWVSNEAAFTPYFALTKHDRGRLSYVAKIDLDISGPRVPDGIPVQVSLPSGGDSR